MALQHGETGTPVTLMRQTYIAHTVSGSTVYPTASTTEYANADLTGPRTTQFAYSWYTSSLRMKSVTTTYPAISAGQNGPGGSGDSEITYFDAFGRVNWHQDRAGFISYLSYDPSTGAVNKSIVDVDTTETSDFSGLPTGWSTPGSGGLHLKTLAEVDNMGRTTKLTDPKGNVTYTVYNDGSHEVRVYAGWIGTGPAAPTYVNRQYWPAAGAATLGRWMEQDPEGYVDGANLYQTELDNPLINLDPGGTRVVEDQIMPAAEAVNKVSDKQNDWLSSIMNWFTLPNVGDESVFERLSFAFFAGAKSAGSNAFVYTCKYGSLDLGHLFTSAARYFGYTHDADAAHSLDAEVETANKFVTGPSTYTQKGRAAALAAGYDLELDQKKHLLRVRAGKEAKNDWADSAFTPEDLISNEAGVTFAEQWDASGRPDVSRLFKQFLHDAGAVAYSRGSSTENLLRREAISWKGPDGIVSDVLRFESWSQALRWNRSRHVHRCLCKGSRARNPF